MRIENKLTLLTAIGLCMTGIARADAPTDQAQALIDKGLAYLKTQQQPDGGWQKSDQEPIGITALALRAFIQDPAYTTKTDFIAKGFSKIMSSQTDEGAYKDLLASYNTAIVTSVLVAAHDPAFQPQIDKAVAYLRRLQWTTDTRPEFVDGKSHADQGAVKGTDDPFYGGWGYGHGGPRPDLSNTQFAVQALKDAGVKPDDPALQAALKFVSRCQNYSETNEQSWAGNDGGFVYGPAADRQGESSAGATKDAAGQRRLRSMGTMSYAGLKSMIYAGVNRDDPRVRAVWGWINKNFTLDENVGLAVAKPDRAKSGLYYEYMTLAKALAAYGEPDLKTADGKTIDWRKALIEKAASIQSPDGSWVGIAHEMENNPVLVTSYVVLALQDARADLKAHPAK